MDHRRHPGAAVMTDADVARTAALAGAAIAHDLFGATHTHFDKGAGDFATEADVAAERAIIDTIRTARPDDAITGEESGHTGPATSDRTWLVDPLCGTLNYAAGTRLVAVNVALRTGTDIAVAAVADPFTDEVFWTDGTTATVSRNDTKEPLKPSAHPPLVDLNLDPPFPNAPRLPRDHPAHRPGLHGAVPPAGDLHHPDPGLGGDRQARRVRHRRPRPRQRALRRRDRAVPRRRLRGDRPRRQPTRKGHRRPHSRRRPGHPQGLAGPRRHPVICKGIASA
ncbi:inositol monophosphatase family protein [Nonomuraea salmonea]|uniref:inositol monophosphatase family protein n=1 Tax=Nonomuraea salmonea TaxID=46181 RepID=UPI002FEB7101